MTYDTNDLLRDIESFLEKRVLFSVKLKNGETVSWDIWEEMNCPQEQYSGLEVTGCDHTFAHTKEWLNSQHFSEKEIEQLQSELRGRDGYCDCTVLIRLIKANREAR